MRLIGNLLWFVFHGVWAFCGYLAAGVLSCLTIIGIPFGIASLRLAFFVVWPFGRTVVAGPYAGAVTFLGNIVWFVLGGWWLAVIHVFGGLLLCLTVIGIPFGLQAFKLAGLAVAPLGKQIVPA